MVCVALLRLPGRGPGSGSWAVPGRLQTARRKGGSAPAEVRFGGAVWRTAPATFRHAPPSPMSVIGHGATRRCPRLLRQSPTSRTAARLVSWRCRGPNLVSWVRHGGPSVPSASGLFGKVAQADPRQVGARGSGNAKLQRLGPCNVGCSATSAMRVFASSPVCSAPLQRSA